MPHHSAASSVYRSRTTLAIRPPPQLQVRCLSTDAASVARAPISDGPVEHPGEKNAAAAAADAQKGDGQEQGVERGEGYADAERGVETGSFFSRERHGGSESSWEVCFGGESWGMLV
ncbi:hypothetical protein S40293_11263 [Stachybotrys chartarum IBT 40293]|nr:hypothetical protein S40293_11263 [Stachybotrys chartarum IBT 40293]